MNLLFTSSEDFKCRADFICVYGVELDAVQIAEKGDI